MNHHAIARLAVPALLVGCCSLSAWAQDSDDVEIQAKVVPGQLDVVQGTAIQLGGKPKEGAPQPSRYYWEIVEGEGGKIYKADEAEAIFQAPIIDRETELFVIQLTVEYPVQKPSRSKLHVRVHRSRTDKPIEQVMAEQYAREREARERRESRRDRTVVVHHAAYPSWHYGYSWRWGWPVHYPVYVPIIVPPPGIDWGPGDGEWVEPTPLPWDEIATSFPEEIADDYLPQDHPFAEEPPDTAFMGGSPADFIEPPAMRGFDDFDPPGMDPFDMGPPGIMDDPGFGGMDFAEPMMDPGFGFDDFGW